ncbi:MAG: CheR family methyltransferase, partial [Candidatus Omnitrophota bacterium]
MRNIMEDIVRDYLDDFLLTRKDICTCHRCKMDMLAYTLSRVPAQYVTSDSGAVHTIINHARVEFQSKVLIQLLKAIEVISKEPRHELIEDEDKERAFGLLLDKVYEDRGLDFRHYRKRLLQRRVAVRMRAYNLSTYGDYLRILNTNPKEYEELFDVLTINVSEFFRDPIAWKAICDKMYIPLFEKKAKDNERFLRIWHAGCAKGEEPYSNAILIADLLPRLNITFSVEIIATDIDRTSLEIAQKGIYRKDNLKNVSQEYLEKYFETIDKN